MSGRAHRREPVVLATPTPVDVAWSQHRRHWAGPLTSRTTFAAGFDAGYRAALDREPLAVQLDVDQAAELGVAVLTPEEVEIVAPALLEAGTRHLEARGTAWHALGHRVHQIAARLYFTLERQETPR